MTGAMIARTCSCAGTCNQSEHDLPKRSHPQVGFQHASVCHPRRSSFARGLAYSPGLDLLGSNQPIRGTTAKSHGHQQPEQGFEKPRLNFQTLREKVIRRLALSRAAAGLPPAPTSPTHSKHTLSYHKPRFRPSAVGLVAPSVDCKTTQTAPHI